MTTCDILCAGAAHWDMVGRSPWRIGPGGDVPGRVARKPGGVAMNVALALAGLGRRPGLLSTVGSDSDGTALLEVAGRAGVMTDHVRRAAGRCTDRYVAIEDPEGLVAAVADTSTLDAEAEQTLGPLGPGGKLATWTGPLVLDGNLPVTVLAQVMRQPHLAGSDLRLVPPSPAKAPRLRILLGHRSLTIYANRTEAAALTGKTASDSAGAALSLVALGVARAVVTDGARPAACADANGVVARVPPPTDVARVTGAGDLFVAAHLDACLNDATPEEALTRALERTADYVGARL